MFIELTDDRGYVCLVNVDSISTVFGGDDGCTLNLRKGGAIRVQESYERVKKHLIQNSFIKKLSTDE
ncbi:MULTISPECIES: hypothetical protein [Bacillus subtilis group]|uniref:hypothetical protein n=1 Tax=Bacillus subtilis group TaxID=653685 RepID=UPI000FF8DC33|nr:MULTISPECIES: hypothetical protein [Bacillus subtilis group]MEC0524290.1 hypothetical protein [Bacillus subtilis]QAS18824.1 hypothetical protein EQJ69_23135 [Bacillus licheniformis]